MSRGNFRLPDLGTEQSQVQVVAPAIANPVAFPVVNRNQELAQILGIIEGVGNVFNKYEQTVYYFNQTKRARMGMAADAAEAASVPLADAFNTGTVEPAFIAEIGDVPPQDLPGALGRTVNSAALAAAEQAGVADDERDAFVNAYSRNVMRYAIPWAKGVIDTQRGEIANAMASDLRINGPSVNEAFQSWQDTPALASLGWGNFVESVVVPSMQLAAADNDFERVDSIYNGIVEASQKSPEMQLTPKVATVYAAAQKAFASQRLDTAIRTIGSTIWAAADPKTVDQATAAFSDAITHGGMAEDLHQAAGAAVAELLKTRGYSASAGVWSLVNAVDGNGQMLLPYGHPVRDAIVKEIYKASPNMAGDTDSARQNRAEGMILEWVAGGMQGGKEAIRETLIENFGPGDGLRYSLRTDQLVEAMNSNSASMPILTTRLRSRIENAADETALDEATTMAVQGVTAGHITPADGNALITAARETRSRLPLSWNSNVNVKDFRGQLQGAFFKVQPSSIERALGQGSMSGEVLRAWIALETKARRSWQGHVTAYIAKRADGVADYGLSSTQIEEAYEQWFSEQGLALLEEATNAKLNN